MRYGHGCLTVRRRKTTSAACRLFPLLVLIAAVVFIPSIHANAEECIGPPDDLYCPDSTGADTSSSSASIYDKPFQANQTNMMAGAASVDTVSITQIDPANFPEICTYVEVLDDNGDPLGGLDADSFCVYQDTVQIDSFTVTELTLDSCITSICLVIDVSGSMDDESKLTDAKASAVNFINQMDVHDRVAIVSFAGCYTVVQDFTSNQTLLTNAVNSLTAGGRTAALDGIYQGLQLTIPELGSKAVIAFSDGMENNSYWCPGGPDGLYNGFTNDSILIVDAALGAGVPIYTISLGSTFDPHYLISIANGSGADYFHAPTGGDIADIYDEIKTRLCSRYEICFVSPDTTQNGDWHDVTICQKDSAGNCGPCGTTPYQEPDPPSIVRTPPTIDLESTCQYWEQDLDICAWVLDADTPADSLTVRLFYRSVSGGSFNSVAMNRTDSLFCYTIPGSEIPCGTDSLDYYITASDGQVTVSSPVMAPGSHYAIPICPNTAPVCSVPDDTTFVQCTPEEVCLPVGCSDSDGNLESGPTIISGPGAINAGQWCYTPAGTEVASVTIECVDSCGASCQASFAVTFDLDNPPPTVQCPGDITVGNDPGECGAVVTWTATADDECPGVTVACTPPSGTLFSLGSTVVTCIATDAGGLQDTCEFTVTVNDTVAPQISCPADLTFECDAVGSFGTPTATDNCDASPMITLITRDSIPGPCPQEYTLELTYEAEDDYGNTDQCQQTITVQDTTPPSITCPGPVAVECESDVPVPDVNLVTASDNCGAVTVTHVGDSPISGSVITRTYRAEDECGNTSECTQEITIDDTTPPSITCPADVTVECLADVPMVDINAVSASDNCGGTVTVVHVDDVSDGQNCPETITRTYRATDESGNSAECTQTITVDDTTPPVISCPADLTFECDNVGAFGTATATDNCDADPTIAVIARDSVPGGCDAEYTLTLTYEASDECGNTATCQQTITVDDTTPPSITCPAAITVDCEADVPAPDINLVTASDNCGGVTVVHVSDSPLSGGACGGTITRTYRATDDCGNEAECTQIITVDDQTDPTISCPADIVVDCEADVPAADINLVTASDNCGSVTVTHEGDTPLSGGSCGGTITRTYRATDACGNFVECTQTITVNDQTDPTISCPGPITVDCEADVPAPDVNLVTASDNCGSVTITHESDSPLSGGPCGGTITRTYRATDACGNFVECTQTITVDDTTPPSITCPADEVVQCESDVPAPDVNSVTTSDNCGGTVTVTHEGDSPISGGVMTRTYRATDACGNFAECTQTITVDDTTPPTITCPADVAVECAADVPAPDVNAVTANDNCGGTVTVIHVGDESDGQSCPETITRTYRATDEAGNEAECTQTITVDDTTPPALTCPDDLTFECDAVGDFGTATATDNCDADPTVSMVSRDSTAGACPNEYELVIRYEAMDDCGNASYCEQTITVDDTTPPAWDPIADQDFVRCQSQQVCIPLNAFDNCGGTVTYSVIDGVGGIVNGEWCYTPSMNITDNITIEAVDECGNAATESFTVTFSVNTPPTCNLPSSAALFICEGDQICLPVSADDIDGNFDRCEVISGPGTIAGGQWCYTPSGDETVDVTIACYDDCDASCQGSFTLDIDVNEAPVCQIPVTDTLELCELAEISLAVGATDGDDNLVSCNITSGPGSLVGGFWVFTPSSHGTYCVTIECVDECGAICEETFCITLIEKTDCDCLIDISVAGGGAPVPAYNDQSVTIPITIENIQGTIEIGGFDLLVCYDGTVLSALDVERGLAIDEWEYFTYRYGADGNCGGPCPSGVIRVVGIADLDNGPDLHPSEPAFRPIGDIAEITFYVTPDRNFIGQCIPITFCAFDCGDNAVSSRTGDTLFVDLYNFDPSCVTDPKVDPVPAICFVDGQICIQEPPDDRGDLNLNFIANEVGDAVLYSLYFINGDDVWDPVYKQSQILASDVNDDGVVLTVADLIYMIRIITGDAQPFPADPGSPKMAPYAHEAAVQMHATGSGITLRTESDVPLGAAFLTFRYSDLEIEQIHALFDTRGMTLQSSVRQGELRVLVAPEVSSGVNAIPAGNSELLRIATNGEGSIALVDAQLSDARGGLMATSMAKTSSLPTSYELLQNYPNPFNAGTVIRFSLVEASDWTLTVYNVTGQVVRRFSGHSEPSQVSVKWNGQDSQGRSVASGLYFYRIDAGDFSSTRKMVLVK